MASWNKKNKVSFVHMREICIKKTESFFYF